MNPFVIYGLHSGDGLIRYVGKTRRPKQRINEHRSDARLGKTHNQYLQDWIVDVGMHNVAMVILETVSESEDADQREIYWIDAYGGPIPSLLNLSIGGRHAPRGQLNHNYGKKASPETRRKISEAQTGEKHWNYGRRTSSRHQS